VGHPRRATSWTRKIERWELDLVEATAKRIRTMERDELQSELAVHLLRLKRRRALGVRNWPTFLKTALRNKALTWIRNWQNERKRLVSLGQPIEQDDESLTLEDVLPSPEPDPDVRVDVARLLGKLDPQLQTAWRTLVEEKGNQVKAGRRLGKHRNTLRTWIRKIQHILAAQGYQPRSSLEKSLHQPENVDRRECPRSRPTARDSVVLPTRLLGPFARNRLSGTQWRILLWVIREISRRKQGTTPFTWSRIAKELFLDRGDAHRAGRTLVRAKILFTANRRIGLRRADAKKRQSPADNSRR
jgi:DNA-directed RNA polymerase specialized sigma24 family protein